MNVYARFDEILSMTLKVIKKTKRNGRTDGRTDGQRENSIPTHKHSLRGGIMTGIPDLGIRVDIMGRVLDPLLCVFLADIQSVGIGACMHVCVWYTELTCISNGVSKTDIVVGKVQCVCVCGC